MTLQLTLTTVLYKDVEIHLAYINKDTTSELHKFVILLHIAYRSLEIIRQKLFN